MQKGKCVTRILLASSFFLWSIQHAHAEKTFNNYPFARTLKECSKNTGVIDDDVLHCLNGTGPKPQTNDIAEQKSESTTPKESTKSQSNNETTSTQITKPDAPQTQDTKASPHEQQRISATTGIIFILAITWILTSKGQKKRRENERLERLKRERSEYYRLRREKLEEEGLPIINEPKPNLIDDYWKETVKEREEQKIKPDPEIWSRELIHKLEWKRFEDVCIKLYKEQGHHVKGTKLGADGGVDFRILIPDKTKTMILGQCKAWSTYKVGIKNVREFYGAIKMQKISSGIYITAGQYSFDSKAFANSLPYPDNIELIDGNGLLKLISELPWERKDALLQFATQGDYTTPTCPNCGIKMVRREAKKGKNIGDEFWGCLNYPRCKQKLH